MIKISTYLALNIQIETDDGAGWGWSRPLVNLTPLAAAYADSRQAARRLGGKVAGAVEALATAAKVAAIGLNAFSFAMGVTR